MTLNDKLTTLDAAAAKAALARFLTQYTTPAFGTLPKREIDLAVFEMLRELGVVKQDASLYDLMRELHITRAKASQLLFDVDVRLAGDDPTKLDNAARDALAAAHFAKDGDYFVLEIENPLLRAHLQDRVHRLGYVSDRSFNSALVRLPLDAAGELVADLIPENKREEIRQALIKAGAPDNSFKAVVLDAVKALGEKAIGKGADAIVDKAGEFLGPLVHGAATGIGKAWASVWKKTEGKK